jgi:hypothetical protein
VKNRIDLSGHSERFRVERNLVLCGHLNRDVGIFVVLDLGNKFCVLCAHITLLSKFMFLLSLGLACLSKFTLYVLASSL